jgi:hypothetical protein
MCRLSVDSAAPPIHQEPLAAVSHSGNCREDGVRWDDSRLNGCLVRRGPLNRRRTGRRMASPRRGIEKEPREKWKPPFVRESLASSRIIWAGAPRTFMPT